MKVMKVEWGVQTDFEVALNQKRQSSAEKQNGISRVEAGKPTKRIVITESGTVLRQCVRAMQ